MSDASNGPSRASCDSDSEGRALRSRWPCGSAAADRVAGSHIIVSETGAFQPRAGALRHLPVLLRAAINGVSPGRVPASSIDDGGVTSMSWD